MAGPFDVVKDYAWTTVPKGADLRKEAPAANVTSYELKESQLRSFVSGWVNVGDAKSQDPMKFYDGIYKIKEGKETEYSFPFFEDNFRSYSNNYADTFSQISQRGAQMMGAGMAEGSGVAEELILGSAALMQQSGNTVIQDISKKAGSVANKGVNWALDKIGRENMGLDKGYQFKIPEANNPADFPGTYVETPKFYQYAPTDTGVEINFLLSNTITEGDTQKNQDLIKNIIKESRPKRGGAIELTFPRIYTIKIPGLRYVKWAYLANAAFNLVGQRRLIDKKIVPEAYAISLVFNSLTIEVENFIDEAEM